ncbi:hypothetical protein D3C79_1043200 [compost metagenome]
MEYHIGSMNLFQVSTRSSARPSGSRAFSSPWCRRMLRTRLSTAGSVTRGVFQLELMYSESQVVWSEELGNGIAR